MYELEAIQKTLQDVADLREKIARIDAAEHLKELRSAHGDSAYAALCGELIGTLRHPMFGASYALDHTLPELMKTVALFQRLAAVMHNEFDVSAYEDSRELRLLELLASGDYRSERRELSSAINRILGEVEESERETEFQEATENLLAAGFVQVERADFDGFERGSERVATDITRNGGEFGYAFRYERDGVEVLAGKSGEFDKLLAAVSPSPALLVQEDGVQGA